MRIFYCLLFIGLLIFIGSCQEETNKPVFQTLEVSDLTSEGVTLNGKIKLAEHPVTDYGFVWSTHPESMLSDSISSFKKAPSSGTFSYRLTDGITTGTRYYVRAFMLVRGEPQYSNTVEFIGQGSSTPEIFDFNPKQGGSQDSVVIVGEHLGDFISSTLVKIGETNCEVLSVSRTRITFRIPLNYLVGAYPITLKSADKSVATSENFTLEGPIVQSISPASGPASTVVTITGSGFSAVPSSNLIYFDDNKATVTSASSTELQVIVPVSSIAGEKEVSIEYNHAKGLSPIRFNLTGPSIDSFSPSSGPPGTQFTIYGDGFSAVPSENIVSMSEGMQLDVISASQNELIVKIPEDFGAYTSETEKIRSLQLTVKSISIVASDPFAIEGPSITGYSPSPQAEGREVTIMGKNLAGFGATKVYFGYSSYSSDSEATIINSSATSITVKIPFGSSGSLPALPEPCELFIKVGSWVHFSPNPFPLLRPWQKVTGFPGKGRYGAVAFTVGSNSYYMTGVGASGDLNDMWRYNASDNTWTQLPNFPGQSRGFAFSFVVGGKAYIGGGGRYSFYSSLNIDLFDLWEFDSATETWTQKSSFPTTPVGRRFAASGIGAFGYFGVSNSWYKYDPSLDQWSVSSLPFSFSKGGIAATIGTKGYFGLGESNSSIWEFDPTTDTWTPLSSSIFTLSSGWGPQSSFTVKGKLYVVDFHTAMVYDPQSNKWERVPYLSSTTTRDNCVFSAGDRGYIFVGRGNTFGTFYTFDPDY